MSANVYWNGQLASTITPQDNRTARFQIYLGLEYGTNSLTITGAGAADGAGLIIDNVFLTLTATKMNMI